MELSNRTVEILKNFSLINQSILVHPGSRLRTISHSSTILGDAGVDENFEQGFAIYDLPRFLGALQLFDKPQLDFNERSVKISSSEGQASIECVYANPEMIIQPPETLNIPAALVTFNITEQQLSSLTRSAALLQATHFVFSGKDGKITVGAIDPSNEDGDEYYDVLGETDQTFDMYIKVENLRLFPLNYQVDVTNGRALVFKADKLAYIVVVEGTGNATSTFGG